jgi:hypothetical protein
LLCAPTYGARIQKAKTGVHHDDDVDSPVSFAGETVDSYLPYFFGRPMLYQLGRNVAAGVTVSLVNVPLSIALAIASNCPPLYGVVSAMWAGFFAALCGGSHFNIVGPTGALSGVLSTYAIRNGAPAIPTLAIVTGVLCMLFFVLNWDVYVVCSDSASLPLSLFIFLLLCLRLPSPPLNSRSCMAVRCSVFCPAL